MFQGAGKLYRSGKLFFEGRFENGLKHGHGGYKYENGDYFEGMYFKDEKRGHGAYHFSEGRVLES